MMREYHYLVASLPELLLHRKGKQLDFDFYISELKFNLHPDDYKKVSFLLFETDNENLLNIVSENNKTFKNSFKLSNDKDIFISSI